MRLSIRLKIILPFAVLLIFVGVIGTAVATARLTDAAAAVFDANLLRSSLVANQSMARLEAARMADLRQATDTEGVPEALASGDIAGLTRLMMPITANIKPGVASIQLHVLDNHGKEILRIEGTGDGIGSVPVTDAGAFTAEPSVIKALAGETDAQGERRIFLSRTESQPAARYMRQETRPRNTSRQEARLTDRFGRSNSQETAANRCVSCDLSIGSSVQLWARMRECPFLRAG